MIQNPQSSGKPLPTLTNPASAAQILSGYQAINSDGNVVNGTIPSQASRTITPGTARQTACASGRYTTGNIYVAGDANLKPENIKSGVTIFGIAGTCANILAGTSFTFETDGSWTCPATGQWQLELHGGGGGGQGEHWGGSEEYGDYVSGSPGYGSGNSQIVNLTQGSIYRYTIGTGGQGGQKVGYREDGDEGTDGTSTTFGSWSVAGGAGGGSGGGASGNIADGQYGSPDHSKPYGNGGAGGGTGFFGGGSSEPGSNGAIILTYLG